MVWFTSRTMIPATQVTSLVKITLAYHSPVMSMIINFSFIAATITDPHHTPALFPCFNNFTGEVTIELNLIRYGDHQSVSVSKLMGSQKM